MGNANDRDRGEVEVHVPFLVWIPEISGVHYFSVILTKAPIQQHVNSRWLSIQLLISVLDQNMLGMILVLYRVYILAPSYAPNSPHGPRAKLTRPHASFPLLVQGDRRRAWQN